MPGISRDSPDFIEFCGNAAAISGVDLDEGWLFELFEAADGNSNRAINYVMNKIETAPAEVKRKTPNTTSPDQLRQSSSSGLADRLDRKLKSQDKKKKNSSEKASKHKRDSVAVSFDSPAYSAYVQKFDATPIITRDRTSHEATEVPRPVSNPMPTLMDASVVPMQLQKPLPMGAPECGGLDLNALSRMASPMLMSQLQIQAQMQAQMQAMQRMMQQMMVMMNNSHGQDGINRPVNSPFFNSRWDHPARGYERPMATGHFYNDSQVVEDDDDWWLDEECGRNNFYSQPSYRRPY